MGLKFENYFSIFEGYSKNEILIPERERNIANFDF